MPNFYSKYPDHWWIEVPKSELAYWEYSPHTAKRVENEVMISKRTELGILSNFASTPFALDKKTYASLEGFWQSLKYPENPDDERNQNKQVVWPFTRDQVEQMGGHEAKHAGDAASENMKILNINWVTYRGEKITPKSPPGSDTFYQLILRATRAKLEQNPKVKDILLKTQGLKFIPDHEVLSTAPSAYKYFEIWMKIRDEN